MHLGEVDALLLVVELEPVAELALHADSVRSRKPPCSSYDDVIDGERVAARAVGERRADRVGERRREQLLDRREPLGREPQRVPRVHAADRAARARREADELRVRAALDAARQVRQVAGEPEQLQLERERERVERRARLRSAAPRRAGRGTARARRTRARSPPARRRAAASPRRRSARRSGGRRPRAPRGASAAARRR